MTIDCQSMTRKTQTSDVSTIIGRCPLVRYVDYGNRITITDEDEPSRVTVGEDHSGDSLSFADSAARKAADGIIIEEDEEDASRVSIADSPADQLLSSSDTSVTARPLDTDIDDPKHDVDGAPHHVIAESSANNSVVPAIRSLATDSHDAPETPGAKNQAEPQGGTSILNDLDAALSEIREELSDEPNSFDPAIRSLVTDSDDASETPGAENQAEPQGGTSILSDLDAALSEIREKLSDEPETKGPDAAAHATSNPTTMTLSTWLGDSTFRLRKLLGSGAYGVVYLVQRLEDGMLFALKTINVSSSEAREIAARREVSILMRLTDLNTVAQLHGVTATPDGCVHLLCELGAGGSLSSRVAKGHLKLIPGHGIMTQHLPGLHERDVKFYAACLVKGINDMHSRNVVHRDLKTENLVIASNG